MAKQKPGFGEAQVFDFAALLALPALTIKPTLEYESKPQALKGPLLVDRPSFLNRDPASISGGGEGTSARGVSSVIESTGHFLGGLRRPT